VDFGRKKDEVRRTLKQYNLTALKIIPFNQKNKVNKFLTLDHYFLLQVLFRRKVKGVPKQLTLGILNENNLSIWLGNRWRQIELNILNIYFRQPFSTGKNRFQGWCCHFANLSHIPNVIRHGIEKVNGLRKNDSIVIERIGKR